MKKKVVKIDWQEVRTRLQKSQQTLDQLLEPNDELRDSIYRRRTAQLARRQTPTQASSSAHPVLVFLLGAERYGLELSALAEIVPFAHCTPVPGAPPELLGVTNLRGEVRSVLDLGRLLELPASEQQPPGYVLLVRHQGLEVGMRVDQIERVRPIVAAEVVSTSEAGLTVHYLKGRSPDRVHLIDVEALMTHPIFGGNGRRQPAAPARDALAGAAG